MILLFSLICPNQHYVGGSPHEYPGDEPPPTAWMNNLAIQLGERVK